MAEELKDLIEKIQAEGVQAAEEKARAIEEEAKRQARDLVEKAKNEAQKIISEAGQRIVNMEEASRLSIKQAARDTLITLRKEINAALDRVMKAAIKQALSQQELVAIINAIIKDYAKNCKEGIEIILCKEDQEKIGKGVFSELKEELQKGITLKPSGEVSTGFLISFDAGKSYFDFTDQALTDYLSQYLKPRLAQLLK